MKKIFTLLLLLSFQFSKAQHYTQGIPFDTTLANGYYNYPGPGCSQTMVINIRLDDSLFNYVSGLQFMIIIDSVEVPPPAGTVHKGDTIILDASHPAFSDLGSYRFKYRIKLIGTPTVAGQTYPCNIVLNICTCACIDITIQPAFNSSICSVDLPNSVTEANKRWLTVFPNPVGNTLSVNGITGKTALRLYDAFGKLVREQEADSSSTLSTDSLPEGVYSLSIDDGKSKAFTKGFDSEVDFAVLSKQYSKPMA